MKRLFVLTAAASAVLLGACVHQTEFDETGGVKITRSSCPAVAVPAFTGDLTMFDPPASREARAVDVTATITNISVACDPDADPLKAVASFDVFARRRDAGPARDVTLPYFATVMRGGTMVISKQLSQVLIHFDQGQLRGSTHGQATATVQRAAATRPDPVLAKINRKRKAGDADASIDPMSDPAVKAAVAKASFELLIGFQLTNDQLAYNATR